MNSKHFFIVGAQRCGTTYFYNMLDQHPEIDMAKPVFPEPKFFLTDRLYAKGMDYYKNKYFNQKNAVLYGEKSTSYLESKKAAIRIKKNFPQANILVLVRNPIARAISNYWFTENHGLESLEINKALLLDLQDKKRNYPENISTSPYHYVKRGRYSLYLSTYEEIFDKTSINVTVMEDMINDRDIISGVFKFLGADPSFKPEDLNQPLNSSEHGEDSLDIETIELLINYYRPYNTKLAGKYNLDLKPWKQHEY